MERCKILILKLISSLQSQNKTEQDLKFIKNFKFKFIKFKDSLVQYNNKYKILYSNCEYLLTIIFNSDNSFVDNILEILYSFYYGIEQLNYTDEQKYKINCELEKIKKINKEIFHFYDITNWEFVISNIICEFHTIKEINNSYFRDSCKNIIEFNIPDCIKNIIRL